jgi:hypothetical protein
MCGNLFEIYTIHFRFECLYLSHPSMQMQGKDVWIRDRDEFLFYMQSLHTYCRVSCHLIDLLLRHIVKYLGCARVRGGRLAAGLLAEGRPCLPCLPCLPWEEWQTVLANEALSHRLTERGSQLRGGGGRSRNADVEHLQLSQGVASLKPDESEGCSSVSGGRTIRLCSSWPASTQVLPTFPFVPVRITKMVLANSF